jgi:hypothetical protein
MIFEAILEGRSWLAFIARQERPEAVTLAPGTFHVKHHARTGSHLVSRETAEARNE